MSKDTIAIANPEIVFREEFDDWAVLFNPETGDGFGINPIGVYIWKKLNGKHTVGDISRILEKECDEVPEDVDKFVGEFIEQLVTAKCAGIKVS